VIDFVQDVLAASALLFAVLADVAVIVFLVWGCVKLVKGASR